MQWLPIRTPQRQLEQLLIAYDRFTPDRILQVTSGSCGVLFDPTVWAGVPRAIVILDLPGRKEAQAQGFPEAKFIPMAVEVEKGDVRLLYPKLRKIQDEKSPPPSTPPATAKTSTERQANSWTPLIQQFDSWDAMKVLEDGVRGQTVRWIDFRIPVLTGATEDERTIHLHLVAGGGYDVGVFAYNLVQRGHKHGVRIVATLKAGADLNVLAIYEK